MNANRYQHLLACLGLVALSGFVPAAWAQVAPSLGSLSTYGIASSTFTNTVAGTTVVGDVCFTTGPFVPATVSGTTGACPASAGTDQTGAIAIINGQTCTALPAGNLDAVIIGTNPPGVIPPGCYSRAGAIDITANGIVTLTGNGVYIFRSTGGAITTGANSQVLLAGGACAGNVFWAATGATTLGATSSFVGNILDAAGITLGLNAALTGRALAFGGTVTTNASSITVPGTCPAPGPPPTIAVTKVSNGGRGLVQLHGHQWLRPPDPRDDAFRSGRDRGDTDADGGGGWSPPSPNRRRRWAFALTSITCTGLGAGGNAAPNLITRTVTLNGVATASGAAISCTFTNTLGASPPVAGPPEQVPTLSEWAMIFLALLLAMMGFAAIRKGVRHE